MKTLPFALLSFLVVISNVRGQEPSAAKLPTVFLIVMENHPWSSTSSPEHHPFIKNNPDADYINHTLLPLGAHAEKYFSHIPDFGNSLPNYLYLESGLDFKNFKDNPPSKSHAPKDTEHFTSLLRKTGIPWKAYEEDIDGESCPVQNIEHGKLHYAVKHDPFMYFLDVTSDEQYCHDHVRPFSDLASDLQANKVTGYNVITPNLIHDMHDGTVKDGDDWLRTNLQRILDSQAFADGAIVFLTWDESETTPADRPIGMIVFSKSVKKPGFSNNVHYTHASTLKTLQEIFGIKPMLGDAAKEDVVDLSDFFQDGVIPHDP